MTDQVYMAMYRVERPHDSQFPQLFYAARDAEDARTKAMTLSPTGNYSYQLIAVAPFVVDDERDASSLEQWVREGTILTLEDVGRLLSINPEHAKKIHDIEHSTA